MLKLTLILVVAFTVTDASNPKVKTVMTKMSTISAKAKSNVSINIANDIIPAISNFSDVFGYITDVLSMFDDDETDPTLEMFNQIMAKLE